MLHTESIPPRRAMLLDFVTNELRLRGKWPSTKRMADYMGSDESSVRKMLEGLTQSRHLHRTPVSYGGPSGIRYVYTLGKRD